MKKIVLFTFLIIILSCKHHSKNVYIITDFGAKGDSSTLCTKFIQIAIDKAANAGGGKVIVPKGIYITGTIILKSNVTLELQEGSKIVGSSNHTDYLKHISYCSSFKNRLREYLIWADSVENVCIQGKGTIDGNGPAFWEPFDTLPRWIKPQEGRVSNMIEINNCKNLKISDVLLTSSPEWTLHLFNCDNVIINGIRIINNLYGPNNDGIDMSGCQNVIISNCYVKTCDDAICLKSFPNSRKSFNVVVTNCILETTCVAFKVGNETWQDIYDVTFSNSVITKSSRAIGIYENCGANIYNINISNITCNTNAPLVLNRPIHISIWKDEDTVKAGTIKNITISNFSITTEGRIIVTGLPEQAVENITFRDLQITYPMIEDPAPLALGITSAQFKKLSIEARSAKAAIVAENVNKLILDNIDISWPGDKIPQEWKYPERIENGSSRVHRFNYNVVRQTELTVLWAKNVNKGYIFAPYAESSEKTIKKYNIINSSITIKD